MSSAVAAADGDDHTVDIAGIVACQEHNNGSQLIGTAQPLGGVRLDAPLQNSGGDTSLYLAINVEGAMASLCGWRWQKKG